MELIHWDLLEFDLDSLVENEMRFALVFMDCDHLGAFNAVLGREVGDAVIKEVVALLQDKIRPTDRCYHRGGGEFAVLFSDCSKDLAGRLSEKLREAFQLRFGGMEVNLTVSLGVAAHPNDGTMAKGLVKVAGDALYVSKRRGRNRFLLMHDGPPDPGEPPEESGSPAPIPKGPAPLRARDRTPPET